MTLVIDNHMTRLVGRYRCDGNDFTSNRSAAIETDDAFLLRIDEHAVADFEITAFLGVDGQAHLALTVGDDRVRMALRASERSEISFGRQRRFALRLLLLL